MFKVGDKVKCINKNGMNIADNFTIDEVYEILDYRSSESNTLGKEKTCVIKDDSGKEQYLAPSATFKHFELVEE